MTDLQERITRFKQGLTEEEKRLGRDVSDCWDKGYEDGRSGAVKIINELKQKNNLLELDLTAAKEIMGCMNKEIEELIKALNYIRSCDSATQSVAKAIETLKKYENV